MKKCPIRGCGRWERNNALMAGHVLGKHRNESVAQGLRNSARTAVSAKRRPATKPRRLAVDAKIGAAVAAASEDVFLLKRLYAERRRLRARIGDVERVIGAYQQVVRRARGLL